MRTSLGLQGSVLLLVVFGSAALTFVAPRPRLLWSLLLAAVCGFCAGRLAAGWEAAFGAGHESLMLQLLSPVVLGAGFAWRSRGRNAMDAGWQGIPYGAAAVAGSLSDCWSSDCGEPLVVVSVLVAMLAAAVLATVGAGLTVVLRAFARRLRS